MENYNTKRWEPANRKPNVINPNFNQIENKRFKIYYDNKPTNNYESKNKICFVVKSNNHMIRMNETEALEVIMDLSKALKWKRERTERPSSGNSRGNVNGNTHGNVNGNTYGNSPMRE